MSTFTTSIQHNIGSLGTAVRQGKAIKSLPCLQALVWSLVEGWQLGRPRDMQRRTEFYGFGGRRWRDRSHCCPYVKPDMCSLQEGTIFSMLSPSLKDQVWDFIGLVESTRVHCLGDTLGKPPYTADAMSPGTHLTAGLLALLHRLWKPFCSGSWLVAARETFTDGSNARPVLQCLLDSSREPRGWT